MRPLPGSPHRSRSHAARTAGVLLAGALAVAACGSDDGDDAEPSTTDTTAAAETTVETDPVETEPVATEPVATEPVDTEPAATEVPDTEPPADTEAPDAAPEDDVRIVALAEERVLADLLALDIVPVATSVTVETAGIQGIDGYDTSGIEVLPMTTLSLEYLASLEPDVIVTYQFWVDEIGEDVLTELAEVVVIPDGLTTEEHIVALGDLMDRTDEAETVAADLRAAVDEAAAIVDDDCDVSLATVYGGPSVAAFVSGPWEIPVSIMAAGCELDPDAEDAEPDRNGRAWLSLEQLGLLDDDDLILMQTSTVEGEDDSLAEIEANPIWQALPAVQQGNVIIFDRLGYPGAEGQIRFLAEFAPLMADDD